MIRNFLFDIGNVLLHFDFAPAVRKLNHRADLTAREAMDLVVRQRDLMEAGTITASQFLDGMTTELAFPHGSDAAEAIYADIFTPNEPVWALARALKAQGYRLVLFSNISPIHADFINRKFEGFEIFDEAIFSFRAGAIKPHEGMYIEAVEGLGIVPAETFYLDDNAENIATGKRFGFTTHVYDARRHGLLLDALAAVGVSVASA